MAIGTAMAIGLGAAALGGAMSASSQKKAASKAADTSMAVAQQNNALARDIYGKNEGYLAPFAQGGKQAFGQYNALLGMGGQEAQGSAFDTFRDSTGYKFRLGEGMNALNSNASAGGWLQSGAALKAGQEYGQNFASGEFGNYMGMVGNSAGMGMGGASALAGVGQNYVGQASFNNQNAADARANAQLIAGQNNPFANALGMVGGGLLSYGMR